jgi:hypothetical protein
MHARAGVESRINKTNTNNQVRATWEKKEKQTMNSFTKLTLAAAAFAIAAAINLQADNSINGPADHSQIITSPPVTDPVYDQNGNPAEDPESPVFTDTSGMCAARFPILAPNGQPITLRQWRSVKGEAQARCSDGGTHFKLKLKNLVPNGVYTIWLAAFQAPGLTPDFANLIGMSALGLPDGSQNSFVASAKGEAELSVLQLAGPYSDMPGVLGATIPACLFDTFEFQLYGAYHPDGQTHGPHPGDACAFTVQFGFDFSPRGSR